MKRIILALTILALTSTSGMAQEKEQHIDVMSNTIATFVAIAKATGMCGVFDQMSRFQKTTKMPGGQKFIIRFFSTEAARLGKTTQEMIDFCASVPIKYEAWKKAFGISRGDNE